LIQTKTEKMDTALSINKNTRMMFLKFLETYSTEQLLTVPSGFSNHLIWNINHCIVTQQLLIYKLSNQPLMVSDQWVEKYRKGSKPTNFFDENERMLSKNLLFETLQKTEDDLRNGLFKTFTSYQTSTGYEIQSLDAALQFNNFHEGIHLGVMLQIRKFL